MKYLMALLMSAGICTFTMAQDYNMDKDMSAPDAKAPQEQMDNSMDNSMNNSSDNSADYNIQKESSSTITTPEMVNTEEVTTVNKVEERESVGGILWRAPFRLVGYTVGGVAEGVGTVGKGAGRIIVSPFRAIAKSFRGKKKEVEVAETTTTTNVQPANVIETNSSVELEKSRTSEHHDSAM